jgi:hypothetical protein
LLFLVPAGASVIPGQLLTISSDNLLDLGQIEEILQKEKATSN